MYSAAILEVLIASPSDTIAQRTIIRQAVFDWNASNARAFGMVLLPVLWETHSFPGLDGRPQGMINKQIVNDADILIATFWTRLGSPTGEADSGTVEEIARFRTDGRPVHIYFCETPVAPLSTDTAQVAAIRSYRDEISQAGLFSSYSTDDELRYKVRDDLTRRIHDMQQAGLVDRSSTTTTEHISDSDRAHATEAESVNPLEAMRAELQGYGARWETRYQGLDDYSVDSPHDLMHEVSAVLLDLIRRIGATDPNSSIIPQLQKIAIDASKWSSFRVYLDGGISFKELSDGCRQVVEATHSVIAKDWS
jgi:hypothetical protein